MTSTDPQAVATLSGNELRVLLSAMGLLWASLCGSVLIVWQLLKRNWALMEVRIGKLEDKMAAFPQMLHDALSEHEVKDQLRHKDQMAAIARHADVVAAPLAQVQLDHAVLVERVGAIEDTDRRPAPRGKRKAP